jgi:HAD superfamily 5'-nucleotidase-like hydrolase
MDLRPRGIFCNRTLNLGSIDAIGYDMDYTLIHYRMEAWERRAYEYIQEGLGGRGWPVADLSFDPGLAVRGLIIDEELGNVVKANRFGYVKQAYHGTRPLNYDEQRVAYARTIVDLRERRWTFLNTLFSISEACMFMQLVDRLDRGELPVATGYADLYRHIRRALDEAHAEGQLKAEIIADPARFVDLDPDLPPALLDQKRAGKSVLLITNSEWSYAAPMLAFSFDRYLPPGMTWRDLFDLAFFGARKPQFFQGDQPAYDIVDESGLLREHRGPVQRGGLYVGGSAALVERSLGLAGGQLLYVGDHIFVDVNVAKSVLRWRTALILREIEDEVAALDAFQAHQAELTRLMDEKARLEAEEAALRLDLLRTRNAYGERSGRGAKAIAAALSETDARLRELDARIAPLARESGALNSARWGLLMRAGNDKSHFARQVERYADIYTSRVSNFLHHTPFAFLRAPGGSLPHDPPGPR